MSFTLARTKDGILTARESWLDEAARPEKVKHEKEREVQKYIRQLRELNEKREAEILKREAEIIAVREHARLIVEYAVQAEERTREQVRAEHNAEVEQEFCALAERWYVETMPLSSYFEKILHPAYQKILTLGKGVVPLILRELQDEPNDWFWALRTLTDDDPVRPEQAGDMQAMAEAWLRWGREHGYI